MRVAISGSWKERKRKNWNLKHSKEEFAGACFDIGFKLAEHEHSVIVGSQSPNTTDRYVVEGIVDYVQAHRKETSFDHPIINILRPKDELFPFKRLNERMPQLFSRYRKEEPDWDTAHLSAVGEADALLVVGGAESSYLAGRAAISIGKQLVPVGSFGGAGRKLLDHLLGKPGLQNKETYQQLYGPWTDYLLQPILDLLGLPGYYSASRRVYDLFLAFCVLDTREATRIADMAETLGLECFLSERHLEGGNPWEEKIRRALITSREMCILVTKSALQSEWVTTEWGAAWALGKTITPVLLNVRPTELPDRLRRFQAVQYENVGQYLGQVKRRAPGHVV